MDRVSRIALAATVFMLGAALPAAAQEPPGQTDPIEQLQGKNVLTDEDRAALRTWIEQRVQMLVTDDASGAAAAVKEWRKRYSGTEGFKQAYVAAGVELIASAYKQAKRDSAARLIAVLNTLNQVSSYRLLIEALGDKRVAVRSAAAIGLRHLREQLAHAGGETLSESITALREAGKRETSPLTLQLIYGALDYTTVGAPPDSKANALALLELLEARGEQYGARNVKAEGADRPGLALAGKLLGQLDEQQRQRLIRACAKMLRYGVTRYTSELHKIRDKTSSPVQIALRNRVELFIAAAEGLLSKLTPAPNSEDFKTVTAEMQDKAEGDKVTDMKLAMKAWANLLQERFQFDVHMEVSEEPTETKTEAEEEAPKP